jgi:hypothetical protein
MVGKWKVGFGGVLQWHNMHTKTFENRWTGFFVFHTVHLGKFYEEKPTNALVILYVVF